MPWIVSFPVFTQFKRTVIYCVTSGEDDGPSCLSVYELAGVKLDIASIMIFPNLL